MHNVRFILLLILLFSLLPLSSSRAVTLWDILPVGRYYIPQNGMYPTLPKGSKFFVNKNAYQSAEDIKRGDIILFRRVINDISYDYIFRVVALPEDWVQTEGRHLFINGKKLPLTMERKDASYEYYTEKNGSASYLVAFKKGEQDAPSVYIQMPKQHFFVMGDNRFSASDSRYWGTVPYEDIIGRKTN